MSAGAGLDALVEGDVVVVAVSPPTCWVAPATYTARLASATLG